MNMGAWSLYLNKMILMNVSSMFLRSLKIVIHLMHIKKELKLVMGSAITKKCKKIDWKKNNRFSY